MKKLALYLVIILAAATAAAQNVGGSLRGTLEDATGARIADATIHVHALAAIENRSVRSDSQGLFRIDGLAPGRYHVVATAPGFAEADADVTVNVSSIRDITVTLRPASVKAAVGVHAQGSSIATQPIDVASQTHQSVITAHDLESLPLAERSFANIAYLAPGTEPVEPSDPTKARITAVSTGGSSGLNNELSVDGADNSDDYIGGFLQNFSPDSIQEFAIRTAQEDADTGGTTAGSVVIKPNVAPTSGMVARPSMSVRLLSMRVFRSRTRRPTPSSRSPGRTTRPRWVGQFCVRRYGFSQPLS